MIDASTQLQTLTAPEGAMAAPTAPFPVREVESITPPSQQVFRRTFVRPRQPIILRGLVADWPQRHAWSLDDLQAFAAAEVDTIRIDSGRVMMHGNQGAVAERITMGAFLAEVRVGDYQRYMSTRLAEVPEALRRQAPTPIYCSGAAWQSGNLWVGPPGTIARLHWDLADNIHAVISGQKRFTLVAPRLSACVYPHGVLDRFPNGCAVDIERPDFERFPRLRGVEVLAAEVGPGDAIYIPRRWWHHVRTVELTISANFWWADGMRRAMVLAADTYKRLRGISR